MHLASLKGNVSPIEMTGIITLYRIPEGGRQGILTATIRPFPALLHRYVKLIRKYQKKEEQAAKAHEDASSKDASDKEASAYDFLK